MMLSNPASGKKDKMTGADASKTLRRYTEYPLGGVQRKRMASYDSATAIGLPQRRSNHARIDSWEFPGYGSHFHLEVPQDQLHDISEEQERHHLQPKLGEWEATAICGNDILSSVLYVCGLVTASSGYVAPVCLLGAAAILHLYKSIYGEAITALPMNCGSYNVLINTTSKAIASIAACLGVISYIATGVVSATAAIAYLRSIGGGLETISPEAGTAILLFTFAVLSIMGISESARVALFIFALHVGTIILICLGSALYTFSNTYTFYQNVEKGFPDVSAGGVMQSGTLATALLFGISNAMLGVSGFESSSQFAEEQSKGVFVKTLKLALGLGLVMFILQSPLKSEYIDVGLRTWWFAIHSLELNMWVGVAIINPCVCLLSLCILQTDEIIAYKENMLTLMAHRVGYWASERMGLLNHAGGIIINLGVLFRTWVSLDAFIVLSGAVLTAYVGFAGLIRRMAKDRCLLQFLLITNRARGTNHYIIWGYFLLSCSQLVLLKGNISVLSGVYTFSFLLVMCIFAMGCAALKYKRSFLPREVTVKYGTILLAVVCVMSTFVVNMIAKPDGLMYFGLYFLGVALVLALVFQRVRILKTTLFLLFRTCGPRFLQSIKEQISALQNVPIVFFCKHEDLCVINKAILYVRDNEQTSRLLIIHCSEDPESAQCMSLSRAIEFDAIYPRVKISLLTINGPFCPEMIEWLSRELGIQKNMMFITCLDSVFPHKIESLGGCQVITH